MDVRYIHFPAAGISCAYTINDNGKGLNLGYAVASPHDEFSRGTGRTLAKRRLEEKIFPFYIEFSVVDLLPSEIFDIMTFDKINKIVSLFDLSGSYLKTRLISSVVSYAIYTRNKVCLDSVLNQVEHYDAVKFNESNLDNSFIDEYGIYHSDTFSKNKKNLYRIMEDFERPENIRERLSHAVKSICREMKIHGEKQKRD